MFDLMWFIHEPTEKCNKDLEYYDIITGELHRTKVDPSQQEYKIYRYDHELDKWFYAYARPATEEERTEELQEELNRFKSLYSK